MSGEQEVDVGWASGDSKLWSWGANSYGQLGSGNCEDENVPRPIVSVTFTVQQIVCGGGHTLIITDSGHLWACGANTHGQLGIGTTENLSQFQHVNSLCGTHISQVAAGWDFTLAVTCDGDLYGWGSNAYGQLGLEDNSGKVTLPTRVSLPCGERARKVAAGLRHTTMVTESGKVYSCGACRKGQLGLGCTSSVVKSFTQVILPSTSGPVVQVTCGSFHTVILTGEHTIFIWGCNKYGQSTQDPKVTQKMIHPYMVDPQKFCSRVKQVASGWTHVLAITDNNVVYSWGRGDYGQLGRSCDKTSDHCPQPVVGLKARDAYCGSEHNLAVTEGNKLVSWGWNEHGMCGNGCEQNVSQPQIIQTLADQGPLAVSCGAGHSFTKTSNRSCENNKT